MAKNLILGPKFFFCGFLPLLDVEHCCKLPSNAISGKTYGPTQKNIKKTSFCAWFRPDGHKLRLPNFFFSKIWLCQSLNFMVSYHHVQYQKKLMIQSWENLVTNGRTDMNMDRETNRQPDESDFIGLCPTNVERPIYILLD